MKTTTTTNVGQPLLPEFKLHGTPTEVPVAELAEATNLHWKGAPSALVESVKNYGVLEPILLIESGGGYVIAAGRKRIIAAKLAGLPLIPALVWPAGWAREEVLALTENAVRYENPAADLAAIETLLADGATEEEISRATGMTRQTLKSRLRLQSLVPALRAALDAGKIKPSVAELAARLAPDLQTQLVAQLDETGRIKVKDVHAAREVQTTSAQGALDAGLFATPDADAVPVLESEPLSDETLTLIATTGWAAPSQLRAMVYEIRRCRQGGGR
jgi:ParB/RepB/Spo0J family partition protein